MDLGDIKDFVEASKAAVDLLKSAYTAMPSGNARQEVENKVRLAEDILKRSDAKLALELGFNLCQCEFPPRPMLWQESEKAWVCQSSSCGHRVQMDILPEPIDDDLGRSPVTGY